MALGSGLTMYGYPGDVNNSIPVSSVYPGGRSSSYIPPTASNIGYRNNSSGELGAMMSDMTRGRVPQGVTRTAGGGAPAASNGAGVTTPAGSWLLFLAIFVGFVLVSKKFGGGDGAPAFGNIKATVYNGIFLTFFVVLILNLLKVFAQKVKVPGVSELILAA